MFLGIDLSYTRPSARAVLNQGLHCTFDDWPYNEAGLGILPTGVDPLHCVVAIDGPQGLAGQPGQSMRACERQLGTPGKSPYAGPVEGRLFAEYVRSSVRLFYSLHKSGRFHLRGLSGPLGQSHANLIEVYPGAAWPELAEKHLGHRKLDKKQRRAGRRQRYDLLMEEGLRFHRSYDQERLPTHDDLDAAIAAYIACLFSKGKARAIGESPSEDAGSSVLREGFIVQPQAHVAEDE